jgi:serine/threonine-protein kinase
MSEGVSFGNYRLLRRLARGGMAEVFLAQQQGVEGFQRRVAIKRILPHLSDSSEFRTMFLDEARLAAQLSHPNIIHIYDFGKVDDYYFIAMEYVDGVDMGRLIKLAKQTPIPFELLARVMADICAGLHYAHNISDNAGKRLNVVHRDVTPQNVLVTYDGIVKVVDFGIAKATWQASRTRPGVVKGKYAYMSPEQVEGRMLDARSDIYSVGICFYEMMTGQPLYRRDNVVEAMKEIRDGKPVHPEQHRGDIPPELLTILHKALSNSRDSRYATAAAMQLDLERYLKNATGLATPQLLGEYLRRESPPGPQGELLVEGADGEPVAAPKPEATPTPAPIPPPTPAESLQGGTAAMSSMKGAVTPAYESPPPGSVPEKNEDPTRPGKVPHGSVGFEDPNDDDLTRRDEGLAVPTSRASVPPTATNAGERTTMDPPPNKSGSHERMKSGPHERMKSSPQDVSKSGSVKGVQNKSGSHPRGSDQLQSSPLGSIGSGSQPQSAVPSDDAPTSALITNPPPPRRGKSGYVWLVVLALVVGGGVLGARHFGLGSTTTKPSADLLPAVVDAATAVANANVDAGVKPGDQKPVTTELPVQTSATLGVYTRPTGAKVFIDGDKLEMLTPVRTQPVTEGPHHVVIERVGYQPRELDVQLKPGEHRVLDFELSEEASLQPDKSSATKKKDGGWSRVTGGNGTLTVKTVPWSKVYEGTHLLGETPLVNLPLPEGVHTLTFQSPDHEPVKKKVVIRVGQDARLTVSLDNP